MNRRIYTLGLALLLSGAAAVGTAQPQPAPPPRPVEPATAAELLVGRWRVEKYDGKPVPAGRRMVEIFTKGGKYSAVLSGLGYPDEVVTGTYRVVGNDVELRADRPQMRQTARFQIVKLTKTELIRHHEDEDAFRRSELVRDESK